MPPAVPIPQNLLEAMDHMNNHVHGDGLRDEHVDMNDQVDADIENGNERRRRKGFQAGKMRPVWNWDEVVLGMFAYIKYLGFWHAILVTGKTPAQNALTAVHFAWPSIFSSRVISEDEFTVDLDNDQLWEVHVPENQRVPGEEAVARARQKVGEKGFNMFTRRSSHVVMECVVRA